jgi:hypothetical protein
VESADLVWKMCFDRTYLLTIVPFWAIIVLKDKR